MDYIKISGYKSIKDEKIDLKPINIFIGANGSGKSNFISFFEFLTGCITAIYMNMLHSKEVQTSSSTKDKRLQTLSLLKWSLIMGKMAILQLSNSVQTGLFLLMKSLLSKGIAMWI